MLVGTSLRCYGILLVDILVVPRDRVTIVYFDFSPPASLVKVFFGDQGSLSATVSSLVVASHSFYSITSDIDRPIRFPVLPRHEAKGEQEEYDCCK